MENKTAAHLLAALAQPNRLATFRALVVAGPQGLTPGVLAEHLAMPAATLSFHLKTLTHAGLVEPTRDGRHLVYRVDFTRMNALLSFLTENCCEGQPCVLPATSSLTCDC